MRLRLPVILALLGASLIAPVSASAAEPTLPGPAESYLFVVDSTSIKVAPEKGKAARIVITDPSATRFSDRPYRHTRPISTRALLRELGWSPTTTRLADPTPNASISIAGQRSHIVEIGKAEVRKGKLVLHVVGIDGPLRAAKGRGSVFIDNVDQPASFPQTQTADILTDSISGLTYSASATLTSGTSVTIRLLSDGETVWTAVVDASAPQLSQIVIPDEDSLNPITFDIDVTALFTTSFVSVIFSATISQSDAYGPPEPANATQYWLFEL